MARKNLSKGEASASPAASHSAVYNGMVWKVVGPLAEQGDDFTARGEAVRHARTLDERLREKAKRLLGYVKKATGGEAVVEASVEASLRGDILLDAAVEDLVHQNPHERAFIAAVRGWAGSAAFVDILLDLAHVARLWESEGGESYRADGLLRLRDEWMRREDPETYAEEVRRDLYRPHGFVPPIEVGCETESCPNHGTVINTISGIASLEERDRLLEQWQGAHEEADVCKACGVLGVPREE